MKRRFGAIDIGSNTLKLLIGETDGTTVDPIHQESIQTRLGTGLVQTNNLSAAAMERSQSVMEHYVEQAHQHAVEGILGTATEAIRSAENGRTFVQALERRFNLPISIITGKEEAQLVFRGINSGPRIATDNQIIVDVGGGSTEIILSRHGSLSSFQSFPVGSVRLLEAAQMKGRLNLDLNQRFKELLNRQYAPLIQQTLTPDIEAFSLVASGGGAVVAAMLLEKTTHFCPPTIESNPLVLGDLDGLEEQLWKTTVEERREFPGMPHDRADLVPIGVSILTHLLRELSKIRLYVSTRGLRFGLIQQQFQSGACPHPVNDERLRSQ